MANVLFTRTSDPNSKPVTDGQLIFDTSGNGKMYLDNGTDRLEMGGALTVDATLSKTSTNPVQNKAVAGVMLDTLSDIDNVTSKGFLTDALAVKQLNTNVNELNNSFQASLEWKLIGSAKGTTPITLPPNFSEILVVVRMNDESYNFNIPKLYLDETNKTFCHGKGLQINSIAYLTQIKILISINKVALKDARISQNNSITDNTSTAITTAYYR